MGVPGNTIESRVREALVKHSRLKLTTVRTEDRLAADLGFDSFALLQVVLDLEDQTGVEIEPSSLAGVRDMTFGQFVELLRDHVDGRRGSAKAEAEERST